MPKRRKNPTASGPNLATNLARRAAFEELVGKTSRRFIGIEGDQLDPTIVRTLNEIGAFVHADRSYVFIYDRAAGTMSNTHEWCAEGIEPQIGMLQDLPLDSLQYCVRTLDESPVMEVPLVAALPPEAAAEKEILEAQAIQSVVLVAMRGRRGQTIGFIGFDAVRSIRPWHQDDVYLLEIVGGIIVAALEHQDVMTQLRDSEARNRATIEAIPDLIFILDEAGTILDFRAPRHAQLALPFGQVKGACTWDVLDTPFHGPLARAMQQAGQWGRSGEFEYEMVIGGEVKYFEGRLTRQKEGEYLGLIRDITERRESEKSLRRLALELSAAEEEQRRELALQLHDGIGQELTGLMFRLQSLTLKDRGLAADIDGAVAILQQTLRHTQDLTFDLSPPILYELGLFHALEALVRRFDTQEEPAFILTGDRETGDLDPSVGVLLYRIARELLLNVVKHAEATTVAVDLERTATEIVLSVSDDGRGLGDNQKGFIGRQTRGGFGLFSIKQRLEPLGGRLRLDSRQGTTVTIHLPCPGETGSAGMEATP